MDEAELTKYVVKRLGESGKPDDLIYDLCEKTGWSWQQAEQFVRDVQAEREPEIAARQLPLIFILSLLIFLGGLALVGYAVFTFLQNWSAVSTDASGTGFTSLDLISRLQWILSSGGFTLEASILGICMIFGSLLGMSKTWAGILSR